MVPLTMRFAPTLPAIEATGWLRSTFSSAVGEIGGTPLVEVSRDNSDSVMPSASYFRFGSVPIGRKGSTATYFPFAGIGSVEDFGRVAKKMTTVVKIAITAAAATAIQARFFGLASSACDADGKSFNNSPAL